MSTKKVSIKYLKSVNPNTHLFLLNRRWTDLEGTHEHEAFLDRLGASWYYGGNRFIKDDNQLGKVLVVLGPDDYMALITCCCD